MRSRSCIAVASRPTPSFSMNTEYDLDNAFHFPEWASQRSSRVSGSVRTDGINASPSPESIAPIPISSPNGTPGSSSHTPSQSRLTFLEEAEWDPEKTYDDNDYPPCLRYSIEWKVTMNGKAISKDTEPEVLIAPDSFWRLVLKAQLEELLRTKFAANRGMRSDDTTVTVSVSQRSQRDLVKRFPQTKIEWAVVERKMHSWGLYFQNGKQLRLIISFNYVDMTLPVKAVAKRGKRGAMSATRLQLAQRDADINAEEEASGQSVNWQRVFAFFRCPGSCDRGPHCWIDPIGKKHYRLRAPHLRLIVEHVERHGMLESHDDVPMEIQQQLYDEERQRQDRKAKENLPASHSVPPITINNVLPARSQLTSEQGGQYETSQSRQSSVAANAQELKIPGFRDDALREYTRWQQSRVRDPSLRAEYTKACDAALKVGFDLEQIYEKQNCEFFVQAGVILGVAERFPRDIFAWNQTQRTDSL